MEIDELCELCGGSGYVYVEACVVNGEIQGPDTVRCSCKSREIVVELDA